MSYDHIKMYNETGGLVNSTVRVHLDTYIYSDTGFITLALTAGFVWLIGAYWQVMLNQRINIVSREQHKFPENIFWMKRTRQAIEADVACQIYQRKRNISFIVFLVVLTVEALLLLIAKP